jgi:hypothetical protein
MNLEVRLAGSIPLRRLHSDGSLSPASLAYWRKQPTAKIVDSLKPGRSEPLIVKADGTVMQGNHRIKILNERGYNIDDAAYPDGVFVQILRELADQGRCTADLQIAFDAAWAAWRANDKASEG